MTKLYFYIVNTKKKQKKKPKRMSLCSSGGGNVDVSSIGKTGSLITVITYLKILISKYFLKVKNKDLKI